MSKYILITDASSSISVETAKFKAKSRYKVCAGARSQATLGKLKKLNLANLYPIILDATKAQDRNDACNLVKKDVGVNGLLALINNAGNNYFFPTKYLSDSLRLSILAIQLKFKSYIEK